MGIVDFDEKSDDAVKIAAIPQGPCRQYTFGHEGAYHALFRHGQRQAVRYP